MTLPTPANTLFQLAGNLLGTAAQLLTDEGLTLPSHRFVSYHQPSWDCCDHLVVHISQVRPSAATDRKQQAGARLFTVESNLVLTYIGCAAVGDPVPPDGSIEANAETMYTAAWVLYQGLGCLWTSDTLLPNFEGCRVVKVGDLQMYIPQGGCEGFTITFTVALP